MDIKPYRITFLLLMAFCFISYATLSSAAMTELSDNELSAITGHGYANFSILYADDPTNTTGYDIARIDLNQSVSTYTEIESLKLGYYDNGAGPGWDQNWTDVSLGSETTDLVMNGLFFVAEFVSINDPAARQLKSVTVGFTDVTGDITANFESLSLLGAASRQLVGVDTLALQNALLAFKFIFDPAQKGIWLVTQ